ncbi:SGNH/GDSL hydrolase family protein [Kribbella sp. CA-293567]|uniref:SGNH/GDSL hydrolase family protein n=1 Tax=Kribbella sp. CA-293567 TaxID=3002436 RepID=UPI0022DD0622|nr:SGNH/GDSL hydrolase family protein [Kribbella sp. CA-293567]WBQ04001.1 SGNH/GDSL hydrolase family protein [Kribbella sp. CA-293567]
MRRSGDFLGLAGLLVAAVPSSHSAAATGQATSWRAAWLTAMQRPNANPNWSRQGFADQSVRQIVRLTAGGAKLRIRLSNQYGDRPLRVTGATVARAAEGAGVESGSTRAVKFGGAGAVSVAVGAQVASDAIALPAMGSGVRLAVTLYFAEATGPATFHEYGAIGASYRAAGDQREDASGAAYRESGGGWYFLAGVDTVASGEGGVVAFGDSVTNGYRTTPGRRYPDLLAGRLAAAGRPMPVLNAGLGGNRLLTDSACSGERGLARFARDVLDQPGITTAIVLIGVNDIGSTEVPAITSAQLIAGYRTLIQEAHSRGIRIIGVTIPPFRGATAHTARSEQLWTTVNTWIRTSGEFDATADFASSLADPADPTRLSPGYDSGDHLHPNALGYRAMADTLDLATL